MERKQNGGKQKDPVGDIAAPLHLQEIKKYLYLQMNSQKKLVGFCFDLVLFFFTHDSFSINHFGRYFMTAGFYWTGVTSNS